MAVKLLSEGAVFALASSQIAGTSLKLLSQLDRPTYVEVNKALVALGGRWDRRAGAHVFTVDPTDGIAQAVATGQMPADLAKLASWWPTPPELARRVVREAREGFGPFSRGEGRVLEPSAGEGAIADVVRALAPEAMLLTVESDERRAKTLADGGYLVLCEPFEIFAARAHLDRAEPFDAIVMNPPFTTPGDRQAWLTHVELAVGLLAPLGRLVAIVPRSVEFRTGHRYDVLRGAVQEQGWLERFPDKAFAQVGTSVATNLLVLDAPADGGSVLLR